MPDPRPHPVLGRALLAIRDTLGVHLTPVPDEGPSCGACGAATAPGITLCHSDASELERLLNDVGPSGLDLAAELDATANGQAKTRGAGGGSAALPNQEESQVPWVEAARLAGRDLRDGLVAWVEEFSPVPVRQDFPTRVYALALVRLISVIRRHPLAATLLDEVRDMVRRGTAIIDRPADEEYVGPCLTPVVGVPGGACPGELYGRPGAAVVTCRACGADHDAAYRRRWMREHARDELGTAGQLARILTALGMECTPARVGMWATRGKLQPAGERPHAPGQRGEGRPVQLYRLGDVEELWLASARAASTPPTAPPEPAAVGAL